MEKEVLKERLTKLVEIGLSKNKTLDFNDVNDFFAGETLTPEELEFVYTYLERKKIDVLRAATEDMAADDLIRYRFSMMRKMLILMQLICLRV